MHPREQLEGTGIAPKRSFGQNFLASDVHLREIALLALARAKDPNKTVVEMGAGLGALTAFLLDKGASVYAIERDRDLVPLLRKRFSDNPKLVVHEDNALTHPLDILNTGGSLAGNLPYHHAAELAIRALKQWPHLGGACFLVQLEVGQRMAAKISTKDYSSLSVVLQTRFEVRVARVVPKGAFWPVPEVDGGVVTLDPRPAPAGAEHTLEELELLLRPAFQQRRKTIRNSLKGLVTDDIFEEVGIAPTARPEELAAPLWGKLAHAVAKRKITP